MALDDFERAEQFRNAVIEQGYGWHYGGQEVPNFFFDLNSGQIYAKQDPESVMGVVRLAREAAHDDMYGDHNALLALVAARSEVNGDRVYWHRPYHVGASDNPAVWISLKDWLTENGQEPDSVFSPETLAFWANR
jgi:hypothetical protein